MRDAYNVDTTSPFQHDALEESYEIRIESNQLEYSEEVDQETARGILDTLSRLYSEGEKVEMNVEIQSDGESYRDFVHAEYHFEDPTDDRKAMRPMDRDRTGQELPVELENAGFSIDVELEGVTADRQRMEFL